MFPAQIATRNPDEFSREDAVKMTDLQIATKLLQHFPLHSWFDLS